MKIENIGSAEVDIGKLAVEYKNQGGDVDAFVANAVASIQGKATSEQPKDVVLYGFGRIGRILARLIISQSGLGRGLSLKAIVVVNHLMVTWQNVLLYVVIQFTVLL
jgi:glyceraldehyde 3-phosphate dehydrogenase